LTKTGGVADLNKYGWTLRVRRPDPSAPYNLASPPSCPPFAMNRRVVRQILIALGVFAGIVLLFIAIAQVTG